MQHQGERSANKLLMRRELKEVGAGELIAQPTSRGMV
jgi:hypothetical protein